VNCAVIFLSNLDFQDPKVLRTHGVAAVKSRSILAPISFDPFALYEYTGWLCTAGGMLRRVFVDHKIGRTITGRKGERITITRANARWFITHEEANHVLEHFAKYAARYPSIGPRELVKFARLRIGADPSEWESWIAKQLTREPVWVLPAPLYVYRFSETPPPAPPPLPEPVSGGVASGPTGAAPASPLSGSAASVPPTFSKKRGAGSSFDRDAYMTCIEVAQPIYAQAERILAQEGIDLSGLWWAEVCAGSGNILRQMPVDRRLGWDINPLDNGAFGIMRIDDYRTQRLDPSKLWVVLTNPSFKHQGPLTLFNWAAEQGCVVGIGIVAPHFFQRHTIENKLTSVLPPRASRDLAIGFVPPRRPEKIHPVDLRYLDSPRLHARCSGRADRAPRLGMASRQTDGRRRLLDAVLWGWFRRPQAAGQSRHDGRPVMALVHSRASARDDRPAQAARLAGGRLSHRYDPAHP